MKVGLHLVRQTSLQGKEIWTWTDTQREDDLASQAPAWNRPVLASLRRTQPCGHPHHGLPAPRTADKRVCCVRLWYFARAALTSNVRNHREEAAPPTPAPSRRPSKANITSRPDVTPPPRLSSQGRPRGQVPPRGPPPGKVKALLLWQPCRDSCHVQRRTGGAGRVGAGRGKRTGRKTGKTGLVGAKPETAGDGKKEPGCRMSRARVRLQSLGTATVCLARSMGKGRWPWPPVLAIR